MPSVLIAAAVRQVPNSTLANGQTFSHWKFAFTDAANTSFEDTVDGVNVLQKQFDDVAVGDLNGVASAVDQSGADIDGSAVTFSFTVTADGGGTGTNDTFPSPGTITVTQVAAPSA